VKLKDDLQSRLPTPRLPSQAITSNLDQNTYEEFTHALCLGLFDYMRKSNSKGYVISLSGGADSSTASILVSKMIQSAVDYLGLFKFLEMTHQSHLYHEDLKLPDLLKIYITTAYQSTENSSQVTKEAAQKIAQLIGSTHYVFDVAPLVDQYLQLIRDQGISLNWKEDDLLLQNIQARVRSPSIWILANKNQAILLSTSNKSEAAVGYATMDGDTSGGLAPLGGVSKIFIQKLLRYWQNQEGMQDLSYVNNQKPTAELRPDEQSDEEDLMPYIILDEIETWAILKKKSPLSVFDLLCFKYKNDYTIHEIVKWVTKFYSLWGQNQWKRERYAPSFHVDDQNLDPKTWCRFPILSGNFKKELEQVQEAYHRMK
ncbi:NAD(+) synthase, partial [bacterium]|nr:NAD(+) synthase [bacterium]